ncbi:hypothetical protein HYS47_04655 [Candidatus Woesearchaeota archaeon]|nr:hypothetical protein [Candidatus Woesearchaeota archaeon]
MTLQPSETYHQPAPEQRCPTLHLFNLDGFLQHITNAADKDEPLRIGQFIDTTPAANSSAVRRYGEYIQIECRGHYPILGPEGIIGTLLGLEGGRLVGSLSVETGYINDDSIFIGRYERIRLDLRRPVLLQSGAYQPAALK